MLNYAGSGQNRFNFDISGYFKVRSIRTPRYPDRLSLSLYCLDWPELTVALSSNAVLFFSYTAIIMMLSYTHFSLLLFIKP